MIRILLMALETRKPIVAAFETDGDNINGRVIMRAPRLIVNIRAFYFGVVYQHKTFIF
jgi:hypothetical protein